MCVYVLGGGYRGQCGNPSSQQGCISFNWSTCGTITSFTQTRYWWQKKTALSLPLLARRLDEEMDSLLLLMCGNHPHSHYELLLLLLQLLLSANDMQKPGGQNTEHMEITAVDGKSMDRIVVYQKQKCCVLKLLLVFIDKPANVFHLLKDCRLICISTQANENSTNI